MGSRGDTLASRIRWSGVLTAVAALTVLVGLGPPGTARAATGTNRDQITGAGSTNSAVTVNWTQGLLDNTNKPIAAANADRGSANPTNPLSFMYPDFKNLQVTVSQTQDITHQGVTVTWKNVGPSSPSEFATIDTPSGVVGNFLQLMECYGDASTGPSPQGCEYGSRGLLGAATNKPLGSRTGDLCSTGAVPDVNNPPSSLDGSGPANGCDPLEPGNANPPDIAPGNPQQYTVPFVPLDDPTNPAYDPVATSTHFDQFTSNEVQVAVTGSDGTGQLQFETLTSTEAPSLGCGELESNGQTRNCWLVIVPRGTYEPNGFKANSNALMTSSPLSASNWAMRIQVHLGYAPIGSFCPIGTQEIQTIGTQIVARAVQSWQLALNKAAKCNTVYGYSAAPESTSTQQLALPGSPSGLAFTTIPIGSEAARPGGSGGSVSLPPILYAPVAVSAVGFGFNINENTGFISTPIKLTSELLAKTLTQVYRTDLPDFDSTHPGPSWSQHNPTNLSDDPQFIKLNPGIPGQGSSEPLAPLITEDHSALNQQVWDWIQADTAATAWLDNGTTSATNSVTPDPDYTALSPQLGTAGAIDSFPRAYTGVLDLGKSPTSGKEEIKHTLDVLPYVNNYDQAASQVLTANDPSAGGWDETIFGPDGTLGWWQKNPPEPLGATFIWGMSDTADLASYGLIDAQLCDDTGANCVAPSTVSLTTALNSAKPDSAGLLQVNPASPGAGGYPLTQVTYAAVDTTRPASDLTAYANLIAYAAGAGQTPGVAPGELPAGYLPLTASLKAQAATVVATLRADAGHSTSPSPSATSTTTSSGAAGATTPAASATGSGQVTPAVSATPTVGLSITPPSAELAATRTGRQPVGAIRWALLIVVMAGAACAAGGTVLRSTSVARWLQRLRP